MDKDLSFPRSFSRSTPTPTLSPSDGERVVEDRVRGCFGPGSAGLRTPRPTHFRGNRPLLNLAVLTAAFLTWPADAEARHPVPTGHPRLLGSRAELQALARERAAEYQRVVSVARQPGSDDHAAILSQSLVVAIEGDAEMGRQAKARALKFVDGPIRQGHVTFGHDLALSALAYDLCFEWWTDAEREQFHSYVNRTVDANVNSETHVFHNAWYGYKNWGIGLAGYACYHENPRAPGILNTLERDYRTRAAPALELAGDGGGWAEGYYIHYWLYEWLFFCEVARRCEGLDYSTNKLKLFTRQIVFLRPDTFIIFDRVTATKPEFKKTWLLQAMKKPELQEDQLVIANGDGKLFLQTLLPAEHQTELVAGDDLYRIGGQDYPPNRNTGPAPTCRVEVSPARSAAIDLFLHVLTTATADTISVPRAVVRQDANQVFLELSAVKLSFPVDTVGGTIERAGRSSQRLDSVIRE